MSRLISMTAVLLALLALLTGPARAQDIGSMAIGSPLRLAGTVASVSSSNVVLNCQGGQVVVPLAYASLTARPVPGVALTLTVGPFQGMITTCDERWVTLSTGQGVCRLPFGVLPVATTEKTRVWVRKKNGKVVDVPLNAALNMQRAQGAVIVGSSQGLPPAVVPVPVPATDVPGQKGQGHGKGHGHNK